MTILDTSKTNTVYLGAARMGSGSVTPADPNAYGFYVNGDGDLIMVYRDYKPTYEIIDGYLYTSELDVSINDKGYLIKEVQ